MLLYEDFPFKPLEDLLFTFSLLQSVSHFFPLQIPILFLVRSAWCCFIKQNMGSLDKIFCYVFFFGNFNVLVKDRLTYSGGTDKLGESIRIDFYHFLERSLNMMLKALFFGLISSV